MTSNEIADHILVYGPVGLAPREIKQLAEDFGRLSTRHSNLARRAKVYKKQITELQNKLHYTNRMPNSK